MDKFSECYLVLTVTLMTVYPIITKYAVSNIHPDYASVISTIPWMLGLMVFASFQIGTVPLELTLKSTIPLLILGTVGAVLTYARYRATASLPINTVIIASSVTPALSVVVAYFAFGDKLTVGQWAGVLLIALGTICIAVFKEVS